MARRLPLLSMRSAWLVGLVALASVAAACGDGLADHPLRPATDHRRGDDSAATARDIKLRAKDVLFQPESLTISSGQRVKLTLKNDDVAEHDWQIDEIDADVVASDGSGDEHAGSGGNALDDGIGVHTAGGESNSLTFVVNKPGQYDFYCTVSGHRESGMVGTLVVE